MSGLTEEARYTAANIPTNLLRCLSATLTELGFDAARTTIGLGFSLDDLSNPSCRVSFRQGSMMIRRALQMAKGRALGLEIGRRETVATIGLVGFAMLTCPTLGDAAALGMDRQQFTGAMLDFDLRSDGDTVSVAASSRFPEPDILIFLIEEAFASFLQVARGLVGPAFRPIRIDLCHSAPPYAEVYRDLFECEVRFGQTANLFVSDAAWMAKPLATHDPLSHRQTMQFLELSVAREQESLELVTSVERLLRQNLAEMPNLSEIARQLCLSERTLRRRLTDQGVSFQSLLDGQRRNRSLELLGNSKLSIEQVAFAVGFSDTHNFRRAFRRWTGSAPSEMRAASAEIWPQ
jgi:AraC-like DNA-binding protein